MRKDIVYYYGWLDKKYRLNSDGRWSTLKAAINLFVQRGGRTIVETGCARQKDDWGGGLSTLIFGDLCKYLANGSHLYTVDINEKNMQICKEITEDYKSHITYTVGDSVEYLKNRKGKIDLLYLDSFDYPYGDLLNHFGGQKDIDSAVQKLESMSEEEVVSKFDGIIRACQEHTVKELFAALSSLHQKSIILIDDNNLAGGGKARLAKEKLINLGYECILDWQQSLWIKK